MHRIKPQGKRQTASQIAARVGATRVDSSVLLHLGHGFPTKLLSFRSATTGIVSFLFNPDSELSSITSLIVSCFLVGITTRSGFSLGCFSLGGLLGGG